MNHPADARLVRLRLNRELTVDVENQAGGATTVSIERNANQQLAAFGLWTVDGGHPTALTPLSLPTVTGQLITPAETPGPAVYRFDVTGCDVPAGRSVVCQPDDDPAADRAGLRSTGRPGRTSAAWCRHRRRRSCRRAASSSCSWDRRPSGGRTPPASRTIKIIRVVFGAGPPDCTGSSSRSCVTLAGLPAPPASTNLSGRRSPPPAARGSPRRSTAGSIRPRCRWMVLDTDSNPLPISDPSYQRIYYRQSSTKDALVTNLFPADGDVNSFLGISPYAGAYPNNGSAGGGQPGNVRRVPLRGDDQHDRPADHRLPGDQRQPARVQQPDRGARRDHRPRQQHHVGRQRHLADRVRRLHPQHLPARPDQHQHRHRRRDPTGSSGCRAPGECAEHGSRARDRYDVGVADSSIGSPSGDSRYHTSPTP